MANEIEHARDRYRARFLTELDGRISAILAAASLLRAGGLETLPEEGTPGAEPLVEAIDEMYRHAHSIRGAAGTLGIEPARDAADILAEIVLHLGEGGVLGDGAVWDLLARAADGLAVFGEACRAGQPEQHAALTAGLPALRADFERRFAPPADAADDYAEVARVLRLTDEEIAAFRFPTQQDATPDAGERIEEEDHDEVEAAAAVLAAVEVFEAPVSPHAFEEIAAMLEPLSPDQAQAVVGDLVALDTADEQSESLAVTVLGALAEHVEDLAGSQPETVGEQPEHESAAAAQAAPARAPSRVVMIFRESGLRMLEQVPSALDALETDRRGNLAMRTARRVFHTIKGDARQIGFDGLATLAEGAEDVFDAIFDAREQDSTADYAVPEEALPLLRQAHAALASLFADPLLLAGDAAPDPLLLSGLQDAATHAAQPLLDGTGRVNDRRRAGAGAGQRKVWTAEERRQRLLPTFLAESRRLVDTLHTHVSTLRGDPSDIPALLGSTRVLHTLKGNAGAMQITVVGDLTHAGETLLERLIGKAAPATPVQLGLLADLEAALRDVVDTLDHGDEFNRAAVEPLLAALGQVEQVSEVPAPLAPEPQASAALAPEAVSAAPEAARLDQVRLAAPRPAPVQALAPVQHVASTEASAPRPLFMPRSSSEPGRARAAQRSLTENLTSVDLLDVDTAVDLFGRLVTSRTMLGRGIKDLERPATESMRNSQRLRSVIDRLATEFEIVRRERRASTQREGWDALELETFDSYAQIMLELGEIIADQEEIAGNLGEGVRRTTMVCESDLETTNELQHALLGFRLVQLSTIEPRLDQVITATARAVGRQVSWSLHGGSIAVDKAVLDAVQEPLLHLLRNAIDHGIELPDDRARAGKSTTGTLTVEAAYGMNSVNIRVADNGAGIDPEKVAAVAVRRGVISAEAAAQLEPRAKLDLIWLPGFSTATEITDISGRGVGLDVVRTAMARIRGTVSVESTVGSGTIFTLTVPLSLSVVRTLLLRDGTATVAAPIAQIAGVHLVRRTDVTRLPDRYVARVEGRTVTLLAQGLARPVPIESRLAGDAFVIVEVRLGAERTAAFVVDEVVGEEDTLVKPLPRYLRHRSTFVGCSVAGNGRPYGILDLRQLAEESLPMQGVISLPNRGGGAGAHRGAEAGKLLVLVVDDSLFMRRSLADLYQAGGFRVETAEDGEAALSVIARLGLPDLISLDMEMPRMNGLEMLSILRQLVGGSTVPVFMITTRGQERHRKAALAAGVTRYFIKPYDADDLLAAARATCASPLASSIA